MVQNPCTIFQAHYEKERCGQVLTRSLFTLTLHIIVIREVPFFFQVIQISSRYMNNNKKQYTTASAADRRERSKLKVRTSNNLSPFTTRVNDNASS